MPKLSCVFAFSLASLFCVAASKVNAAVIANFDFNGNDYVANTDNTTLWNTGLNLSSTGGVSGVTVGLLQFSPNLDPTAALGFSADAYDNALGFSSDANSDRNLLSTDQAIYFDVTVQSGFILDLHSLSFDSLKTRGNNATGSRVTYSIFVNPAGDPSVDGLVGDVDFVTNLAHDHFAIGQSGAESTGGSFTTGRWSAGPVDLSGNQGLTGSNRLAIRIYGSDGGSADQDFGIDNLILNGQVTAIPEPTSLGWMLLGAAVLTCRRRR